MMNLWHKITRAFRKPKVRRPYRPSAKQVALAARAEAVGLVLQRSILKWSVTKTLMEHPYAGAAMVQQRRGRLALMNSGFPSNTGSMTMGI